MIDSQMQREGSPEDTADKRPRKVVYTIIDKPNSKSFWFKIGIAKINQDNSMNIYLDALPLNGKLQLRDERDGYRPSWQKSDPAGGAS